MDRLSLEHQKLLDTHGIDGETVLKDNTGRELKVYWSEAGNYIFLNPGGWGDGKFFLTTVLLHFMTNDEPMGLCLAEEEEGNDQVIEASEMERLRTILTMRYKNED
ncbi:MAG: hypothetical protein QF687_00865 [Nitrospinaceae bacterium]|jgi:hypothetical protein|nr:hypothetical protein [Nitrospinota bacterium]MDP6334689.1 hypothetical protein [Nitrospinaceae bacterium]HAX47294.1 hypothetical protein [Nitrospina sp.]MBV51133.1 hypothetical protein [Nitrospinota bacterium]MDP7147431.1 hypothetical protein [Nitrospinaceae bacterium]|tara:strand:+ start:3371 stop:3688 length:318 start_codon:yes stop_codon:yes gene_type:complete